jgi:hypothetical protein
MSYRGIDCYGEGTETNGKKGDQNGKAMAS